MKTFLVTLNIVKIQEQAGSCFVVHFNVIKTIQGSKDETKRNPMSGLVKHDSLIHIYTHSEVTCLVNF